MVTLFRSSFPDSSEDYLLSTGYWSTTSEPVLLSVSNETSSDCITLDFLEYIPWNNPDNIVSFAIEDLVHKLKDLVFLPILFFIGCPANVINMLVFYKHGLKERINVCLFALSLADELYLVSNMLFYGEQLLLRNINGDTFGPVILFLTNNNLLGFYGFAWISQIMSAIIASERCFCILQPLRSQAVLRTSTMTVIIVAVYVITLFGVFMIATRYRLRCAFDPPSNRIIITPVPGQFYLRHQQFINNLDAYVFGAGLPGIVIVVVVVTTMLTAVKLRQAVAWREGTSSGCGVSRRDIALTKMLAWNSCFFIACVVPTLVFRPFVISMPEINTGGRQHNFYMMMLWIITSVGYVNSTFNIVVYYVMGSRYRQTFWQLFQCKKSGKSQPRLLK